MINTATATVSKYENGQPMTFTYINKFESNQAAVEFANSLPSSVRAVTSVAQRVDGSVFYWVNVVIDFTPKKNNPFNEAGIDRFRTFAKHVDVAAVYTVKWRNSYATYDEFIAAIDAQVIA